MTTKWEYLTQAMASNSSVLLAVLADLGREGWELVCVLPDADLGIFKRPLADATEDSVAITFKTDRKDKELLPVKLELAYDNQIGWSAKFYDVNSVECLLQYGRGGTTIWLGQANKPFTGHVNLSREHVAGMLPLLERFVKTGSLGLAPTGER